MVKNFVRVTCPFRPESILRTFIQHTPRIHPLRRGAMSLRTTPLLLVALAACGGSDSPGNTPVTPEPAPVPVQQATCTAPVRLAIGEAAELPAAADGGTLCPVSAQPGAEFVVAVVDTRAVRKAETGPEGYGAAFPRYTVAVSTAGQAALPDPSMNRAAQGSPHFAITPAPPADFASLRNRPWTVGELFPLYDPAVMAPRQAQVLRVYDGHFVVAAYEGDAAALLPRFMAQMDSAWDAVGAHAVPLMRAAYSRELPVTSPASGQFLIILRDDPNGDVLGRTLSDKSFGAPRMWTDIKIREKSGYLELAELVAHEVAHAFQALYMYDSRPDYPVDSAAGATFWATEGGADLISFETVRRASGVGFTANFDARAPGATPAARRLGDRAHPGFGHLSAGYDAPAGFLRILASRRVLAGEAVDDAIREVLRGAADGWNGWDSYGVRRTGLNARMRARLGPSWNGEDALLDWALAHAADDLTSDPRFQDPLFLRIHEMVGRRTLWRPFAIISASGAGFARVPYGSPAFFLLKSDAEVRLSGVSDTPGLRWKILRTR